MTVLFADLYGLDVQANQLAAAGMIPLTGKRITVCTCQNRLALLGP
jgi:hypothetical protein